MSSRLVLVTGATGNQGRAVASALLDRGLRVRAMARKPNDERLAPLVARGAEVVHGDYGQPDSLPRAAEGADAAFVVTTPFAGVEQEVVHGKAMADAVAAAGVPHLVFSSVSDADRDTGIPHFDSKYAIEQHLSTLSIDVTITAPAFFYDNVMFPWNVAELKTGRLRQAMPPSCRLQMVSTRDIGRFNALALDRREDFAGKRINYAADALTGPEMARILADAAGRTIAYEAQSLDEVRAQFEDMAAMYAWFDAVGFSADIAALKRDHPGMEWSSFADWAKAQPWAELLA